MAATQIVKDKLRKAARLAGEQGWDKVLIIGGHGATHSWEWADNLTDVELLALLDGAQRALRSHAQIAST